MPVLYCERYFASVRHDLSQSVASLQPDAHRPLPVPQRRLSQIRYSGHLAIPFHFDDTTRPLPKRSFVCASTATCGSDSTRQAESCGAEPSRPEASLPQRRGCGLGRKHAPLRQIHFHIHKYRTEMNLSYIIGETLLMAGFTFIVGIAFAYALKLTTFFFFPPQRARSFPSCAEKPHMGTAPTA